jgi:putative flippase GtrA
MISTQRASLLERLPFRQTSSIKWKFLGFLAAGGASVPFNFAARIMFTYVMPFEIAVVLSHGVGMMVAYGLNRAFVFESTRSTRIGDLTRFAR